MTTSLLPSSAIDDIRMQVRAWRRGSPDAIVGFVPTMGALHAGHARLIEQARGECARVVVSIFVNPLQFDRRDDLEKYPRTLDADLALCERLGVDAVFTPTDGTMYPTPPACTVDVGTLADHLCGAHRPGHFRGVATVVLKLFQIVEAHRAYFGEKDAQQLAIIRRMVSDFNLDVTVVGVATVREADGLALSSRNVRLSAHERALAPALYRALTTIGARIAEGKTDPNVVIRAGTAMIPADPALRLEYLDVVDPFTLRPVERITSPVLVAGALWAGSTRLIDNVTCAPRSLA